MQQFQNLPFGFPMGPFVSGAILAPPFVDDRDLFINSTVVGQAGSPGPSGPPGAEGPPGTPGLVPTTIVSATPFTATLDDYFVAINVATAASVVLPISPAGTVFIIKDASGNSASNPITISDIAGALIDGFATALINAPYAALHLVFNGTEWNIV